MELSSDTFKKFTENLHLIENRRNDSQISFSNGIDYIEKPVTYDYFFENYLVPNKPCMFANFLTDNWEGCKSWISLGNIQWEFLKQRFGEATVPVVNCSQVTDYGQKRLNMQFSDFCDYMMKTSSKLDNDGNELLYLKDWHFARDYPDYHAYSTPKYFTSDWLNEFWEQKSDCHDDYRFLYMGRAGTSTPFHADVFRSYSWSANVCGRKKWILYPAGDERYLMNSRGELPSDVTTESPDITTVIATVKARRIELIQNPGEVIFVPSGWHHQVTNLEDTISINHNWLNGCNIDLCWSYIKKSLDEACEVIQDLKNTMEDWVEQCQLILRANVGIDFIEFYNMLHSVATTRLTFLEHHNSTTGTTQSHTADDSSGRVTRYYDPVNVNHTLFDLQRVLLILHDMNQLQTFQQALNTQLSVNLKSQPNDLYKRIKTVLELHNVSTSL